MIITMFSKYDFSQLLRSGVYKSFIIQGLRSYVWKDMRSTCSWISTRETRIVKHTGFFLQGRNWHLLTWKAGVDVGNLVSWFLLVFVCLFCWSMHPALTQTPEHCFSVSGTHPHERGSHFTTWLITKSSSLGSYPEHSFSVARAHPCGRSLRCSTKGMHFAREFWRSHAFSIAVMIITWKLFHQNFTVFKSEKN